MLTKACYNFFEFTNSKYDKHRKTFVKWIFTNKQYSNCFVTLQ